MNARSYLPAPVLLLLLLGVTVVGTQPPQYDLVILNGRVVDGTGSTARLADVAVSGGTIARVGNLRGARAAGAIDATGRFVTPGFIDVHTHADDPADTPSMGNF